jgi:3-phenylpropionate/trans-cinnamate dioxygenase ferredoxin subunit
MTEAARTVRRQRHVVFAEGELEDGQTRLVEIGGRSIGVMLAGGRYYALRNVCPHHGAPLCRGTVSGTMLPSDVYTYVYDPDAHILRCPWHGYEFRLESGQSIHDPKRMRVRAYDVAVEAGEVVLYV